MAVNRKVWSAWEKIFNEIKPEGSSLTISADQIKDMTRVEPRVMAKFDTREDYPEILQHNSYMLLPIKNGIYTLVKGEPFHDLEQISEKEEYISGLKFKPETLFKVQGESCFLDYAYLSGLLEHFLEIKDLKLTIRGRSYSPFFRFNVGNMKLEVDKVQIEIDAGYESVSEIVLVEAKVGMPSNFNIRQLYYPYRSWCKRLPHKRVIPVFFVYDKKGKTYNFWQYEFTNHEDYNSISLVKSTSFIIKQDQDWGALIRELVNRQPDWSKVETVPQADDFERVTRLPLLIAEGINDADKFAKYEKFTTRQSSYYREAAELVGLVKTINNKYLLTEAGEVYVNLNEEERGEFLLRLLLKLPIIHEAMSVLLDNGILYLDELASMIEKRTRLGSNTPRRRAQTVKSWLKWFSSKIGIFQIEKESIVLGFQTRSR